jgi:hypothetical protein
VTKIVGLGFIWLIGSSIVAGCNPPADYALVGSAYVPAAHGDIRLEKIDREQVLVNLRLDHLPPPERVEEGVTHYVVWFSEVGEYPVRQQTLDYDLDTGVGQASIPTTMRRFDVRITAEQSDSPTRPSDLLVASQKIRED